MADQTTPPFEDQTGGAGTRPGTVDGCRARGATFGAPPKSAREVTIEKQEEHRQRLEVASANRRLFALNTALEAVAYVRRDEEQQLYVSDQRGIALSARLDEAEEARRILERLLGDVCRWVGRDLGPNLTVDACIAPGVAMQLNLRIAELIEQAHSPKAGRDATLLAGLLASWWGHLPSNGEAFAPTPAERAAFDRWDPRFRVGALVLVPNQTTVYRVEARDGPNVTLSHGQGTWSVSKLRPAPEAPSAAAAPATPVAEDGASASAPPASGAAGGGAA